ncbi:aldo/keto reductase [Pseudonocardia sp. NPDC049635]|uniref:aldo/keto reductase n=1 Tax=Pseudonocardia sp. NPDC049635 TaxID=3155506 RepID=UPI0033DF145A
MQYATLGTSGVEVSRVALGTATFGLSPRDEDVAALVGLARDLGVTYFDTANSYGNQPGYAWPGVPEWRDRVSAEELLGRALRGAGDEVVVASKVGEPIGESRPTSEWRGLLTREHVEEQVGISLQRLGRTRIDIYYAHLPDPVTPIEETVSVFSDLVDRGDIGSWGISNYTAEQTAEVVARAAALGVHPPIVHQARYNLANREVERDLVPVLERAGIGLAAYSPLGMGLLAGRAAAERNWSGHARWGGGGFSADEIEAAGRFEAAAASIGLAASQAAIVWLLGRPAVTTVVVGATSEKHLRSACGSANYQLDECALAVLGAVDIAQERADSSAV